MFHPNVADGIHRIEDAFTNWYLVEFDEALIAVDAGVPASWHSFHDALGRLGRSPSDLRAVVLTHAHFDHVGFAERARRELGVPVWVHENDVPLARHPHQYSHESSRLVTIASHPKALPIVAEFLRKRAFWPDPVREVRRYGDGYLELRLDLPGAPHVVATPGHTIGHCSLHFIGRDTVIAGDAIVTLDPYTGETGPRVVSKAATADSERALRSLAGLVDTGARTVLPGHGEPFTDGVEAAVAQARAAGVG